MYKTAEAVTPKHPDKTCDRISDAILDECLKQDKDSRVAVEVLGGHGIITVTGELTTNAHIDVNEIVNRVTGKDYGVQVNLIKQSPEISKGVDTGGAGDQGIMVGYACRENQEFMPHEFYLARSLCKFIYDQEDGKTQITVDEDLHIKVIVASFNNVSRKELLATVIKWLEHLDIKDEDFQFYINPAGDWSVGSFDADAGLTGRKIVADAYGPRVPVGGGAFSGKDPSKVDRSGAYYARYLAMNILKTDEEIQEVTTKLAFAIGMSEPVDASFFGKFKSGEGFSGDLKKVLVKDMIDELDLKNVNYEKTAEWGAFGHKFNWDK